VQIIVSKLRGNSHLQGVLYMLVAMFALATMDAVAKYLVHDRYDPVQILAMRGWIILIVMLVYYSTRKRLYKLKPTKPLSQMARGAFGFLAPYFFFKSLQILPLADATVIFFSSTFMVTALSALVLKEKVGWHRWSAVVVGFIGVIIAMNPEGEGDLIGYLYCLLGSISYSVLFISGRWLSRTESVDSLVFGFNLSLTIVGTILTPWVYQSVHLVDFWPMIAFAALALIGHFFITHAFSLSDVAVIAPLEYTALIWAVLWGYLIWADVPSPQVILGAAIVIGCALFVVYREARAARVTKA